MGNRTHEYIIELKEITLSSISDKDSIGSSKNGRSNFNPTESDSLFEQYLKEFPSNVTFKKVMYFIANMMYIIFIFLTISWKPIYKIVTADSGTHFMSNSFVFIILIQYFVELMYFRTGHFYKTLSLYPKLARHSFMDSFTISNYIYSFKIR